MCKWDQVDNLNDGKPSMIRVQMGSGCSNFGTSVKDGIKDVRVLMIGLDNAGKTEILYRLKLREPVFTLPYIGFNVNVETLAPVKGLRFTVWDIDGGSRLRSVWKYYYEKTEAVIYVVDSSDPARFQEARAVLLGVLGDKMLKRVPLLIIANKADLDAAVHPSVVERVLEIRDINDRPWCMCGVSGTSGDGLHAALRSLAEIIEKGVDCRVPHLQAPN